MANAQSATAMFDQLRWLEYVTSARSAIIKISVLCAVARYVRSWL